MRSNAVVSLGSNRRTEVWESEKGEWVWGDASCSLIKHCSQCREATVWIDDPAVSFRWCVADCTDHSVAVEWLELSSDVGIDEAERIIRSEHDVRWLGLTKHDRLWLLGMGIRKNIE